MLHCLIVYLFVGLFVHLFICLFVYLFVFLLVTTVGSSTDQTLTELLKLLGACRDHMVEHMGQPKSCT